MRICARKINDKQWCTTFVGCWTKIVIAAVFDTVQFRIFSCLEVQINIFELEIIFLVI